MGTKPAEIPGRPAVDASQDEWSETTYLAGNESQLGPYLLQILDEPKTDVTAKLKWDVASLEIYPGGPADSGGQTLILITHYQLSKPYNPS